MIGLGFLERLAEEKISQAIARGEFDDLPGAGRPIPDEDDLTWVPVDLRMAYRVMKNAGFVPEEVRLRREIADTAQLLALCDDGSSEERQGRARLRLLMQRLGEMRGGSVSLDDAYARQLAERFDRQVRRSGRD